MADTLPAPKADAHIHLFDPGFAQGRPAVCRQVQPTEVTLYTELIRHHNLAAALVVGYEGDDWARGNNAYLAQLQPQHPWLHPVAYVHDPRTLDIATLERYATQGFVGISLYIFGDDPGQLRNDPRLTQTRPEIWEWLVAQRWLISVNSTGAGWYAWADVLSRHPDLRLLLAHLGLPPRLDAAATRDLVQQNLASVLALATASQVAVKISGLYALSEPGYAFPHTTAWPYIETLLHAFGRARMLWGSDFTPALNSVSFVQTVNLLETMPFLTPADRAAIEHDNLMRMLQEVRAARKEPT
ncbi:MAG: amidohydrolase family protein [Litorilinea sp.]